ncbi:hypothetical protein Landi51_13000 [Colletotrichum acutatum]
MINQHAIHICVESSDRAMPSVGIHVNRATLRLARGAIIDMATGYGGGRRWKCAEPTIPQKWHRKLWVAGVWRVNADEGLYTAWSLKRKWSGVNFGTSYTGTVLKGSSSNGKNVSSENKDEDDDDDKDKKNSDDEGEDDDKSDSNDETDKEGERRLKGMAVEGSSGGRRIWTMARHGGC